MASDIEWTEETVARLRAFWEAGIATAEIGRRMGTSKNSVIGKAHRLGLPPRPSPIRGKGTGSTPRPPAPARTRSPSQPPPRPVVADSLPPERPPRSPAALRAPPTRADPPPPPLALAEPERPALARPALHQPCCWPIGEPGRPGFRFCDADAMPRKPYCAEHAGTAYVDPEAARDRPNGRSLDTLLKRGSTRTT